MYGRLHWGIDLVMVKSNGWSRCGVLRGRSILLVLAHGRHRGNTGGNCAMLSRRVHGMGVHGGIIWRRSLERWRHLRVIRGISIGLMDLGRRCRSKGGVGRIRIGRWYTLRRKLGIRIES